MSDNEQVTPPGTPPEEILASLDVEDRASTPEVATETAEKAEDMPMMPPPPVPSFPPDFPVEDNSKIAHDEEEEDFVVEQVPYVADKAASAAKAEESKPAAAASSAAIADFFIIRRRKENFFSPPVYSIELYDPEGAPESTYRIYAQINTALKPYFSISGDKEDFSKKREKRSHLFIGKLVVEKSKKIYIGAMQNTEDRTKSHMVSIVFDPKMEVAVTLVPTPTLHDEFMLMRVNGTQNNTRVNELFVLKDVENATTLSQIVPMKLKGKMKAVPSNTIFALSKFKSSWGKTVGSEVSKHAEKPEGFLYMQVGKIRESKLYPDETTDTFSCQFQDPVTMVTAFMIILSYFDFSK